MKRFTKLFMQIIFILTASVTWAKDVRVVTFGQSGTYSLQATDKKESINIIIELHPPQTFHKALVIGGYNALKSVKVLVNGKPIAIPLGCTYLLDVDRAFLEGKAGDWRLIFDGGDASESYEYLIGGGIADLERCHHEVKKNRPWLGGYEDRTKRSPKTKN